MVDARIFDLGASPEGSLDVLEQLALELLEPEAAPRLQLDRFKEGGEPGLFLDQFRGREWEGLAG